ncbi:hypothetical protein [Saccharothrix sp. ST-888]|uniref:hypothetical protein n=1 Tax=Saccharothrix sp. ST-888 TaxID=1427391 RepID=UPI000A6E291D|nr:hypothetical protein [Saccharothrix sp. ST-888]
MDRAAHLVVVDELLARPFPDLPKADSGIGVGQSCNVVCLESETKQTDTAEEFLTAGLISLIDVLRTRWGQPQNLVMDEFADPSLDEDRGLPLVAAFGDRLIELSGWAVRDRWVGCGIARSDDGTALHLVAAVAERADPALRCLPTAGNRDWASASWAERLAAVTGWEVARTRSIDWPSVEERLGLTLPTDYKDLAERFGSGEFDGFLWLSTPDTPSTHHDLIAEAHSLGVFASAVADAGNLYNPYAIFPAPGGLLRWADSVQADQFYWLTDSADPDRWPIIACNEDGDQWERFDGSTAEFIHRVLTDTRHPFSVAQFFDTHTFESFERTPGPSADGDAVAH